MFVGFFSLPLLLAAVDVVFISGKGAKQLLDAPVLAKQLPHKCLRHIHIVHLQICTYHNMQSSQMLCTL